MSTDEALQRLMGLAETFALAQQKLKDAMRTNQCVIYDELRNFAAARSALESALREALQPAGWRPIETAPREGQRVLLAGKGHQGTDWVCEGYWDDEAGKCGHRNSDV